MKRRIFVILLLALSTLRTSTAHAATDPALFVRSAIDQVFDVLREPALKKPERRADRMAKLRVVVDRAFDWQAMAQSSLGVTFRKITDEQRREFVLLFTELIAQEYMDDMDRFIGDERVEILGVQQRDDQRIVKTILVTHSRDRVPIDYFLRPEGDGWRVIDFSVEGVSLVNHYRASFGRYLANHTFEELLARLRARAKPR